MAARRSFWTNVTIVTAAITFVGGVLSTVTGVVDSAQRARNEVESAQCKLAYDALSDDKLNPALTPAQQRLFLAEQLKLARKCVQRIG